MRNSQAILILGILFTFCFDAVAIDLGDGSDSALGNCDWENGATLTKGLYQCEDIVINAGEVVDIDPSVSGILEIKALGEITINGTIDLSANGIAPGPGGFSGGPGKANFNEDGDDGQSPSSINSFGGGAQSSGAEVFDDCGGGGGAGALHGGNLSQNDLEGQPGDNSSPFCNPAPAGDGGIAPTQSYGNPGNFSQQILGGSGGGGGGVGEDTAVPSSGASGAGGGGGGALRLYAGGNITLGANAEIRANGGNGGNGANQSNSGGGGGGSGGAIYIVSLEKINITAGAFIRAEGGTGGTGNNLGGNGGDGDSGYIRLEDSENDFPAANDYSSPHATTGKISLAGGQEGLQNFQSNIEAGCAFRAKVQSEEIPWPFSLIFIMPLLVLIKFKCSTLGRSSCPRVSC